MYLSQTEEQTQFQYQSPATEEHSWFLKPNDLIKSVRHDECVSTDRYFKLFK